jgi:hypothetical protein
MRSCRKRTRCRSGAKRIRALAAQNHWKLIAEAPPHINPGEAAFLLADILQHEAEAALGNPAPSLDLRQPRSIPVTNKEGLTVRYLTEPTTSWMQSHTDFRKCKEPQPKKADAQTDAIQSIRASKDSIK